jgi:hypothetical protein
MGNRICDFSGLQHNVSTNYIIDCFGKTSVVDKLCNALYFKKSFTTLKAYYIYSGDMYRVSDCHNVAKYTEFYLG